MSFNPAPVLGGLSGISNSAANIGNLLGVTPASYFDQLQPASWRGIPFVVLSANSRFGRRLQNHMYPFRDLPWLEDLGRRARSFRLQGYILGDDVISQRENLIKAIEASGPGVLVHPTFGAKTVTLTDCEFIERWDKGRYFEVIFAFTESGQRNYPNITVATQNATQTLLGSLISGASLDFASSILSAISAGAGMAQMVVSTAMSWEGQAQSLVTDASNLFHLLCQLPGEFGRFFGANATNSYQPQSTNQNVSVTSLISEGAQNRQAVASAGSALNQAAKSFNAMSTGSFCAAAQSLATAVGSVSSNPGDAIRILSQLAAFNPNTVVANSTIGQLIGTVQYATGALFRRSAIVALANATTDYQPTSFDDAQNLLVNFTALIDSEILIAGDNGDDNSFAALRAIRQSVVADLRTRGSALAKLATFSFNVPLPAMYLANRMYQDPTRSDQLITQVNPRHPLFMPTVFNALAQ